MTAPRGSESSASSTRPAATATFKASGTAPLGAAGIASPAGNRRVRVRAVRRARRTASITSRATTARQATTNSTRSTDVTPAGTGPGVVGGPAIGVAIGSAGRVCETLGGVRGGRVTARTCSPDVAVTNATPASSATASATGA